MRKFTRNKKNTVAQWVNTREVLDFSPYDGGLYKRGVDLVEMLVTVGTPQV